MLSIEVNGTPGSTIEETAKEAMELADKLNICIDFKFNDVLCMALPGGDYENIVNNYFIASESKNPYQKFASSHKRE